MFALYAVLVGLIINSLTALFVAPFATGRRAQVMKAAGALTVVYTLIALFGFWRWGWTVGFSMVALQASAVLWIIGFLVSAVILGIVACGKTSDLKTAASNFRDRRYYSHKPTEAKGRNATGAVIIGVIVGLIGVITGINATGPWVDGGANKLASQIRVDEKKPGTFPDTDTDHIVIVPEQAARTAASGAIAKAGANFTMAAPVLQSINDHAYWIIALDPVSWRNSRINHVIPGYIVVDAENPSASASYRTTDASGKPLDIHYSSLASFGMKLQRHVWKNGYAGKVLDDWNLEIGDDWRPYYTASVNRISAPFKETVPSGMITVDASTGEIKEYSLDKRPAWVDRIYSAETAKLMVNWWGNYQNGNMGFLKMGRGLNERYQVSGEPTLVYTEEDYPVWQMVVTTMNNDSSGRYLALFDGRTSTVRLYSINNLVVEQKVIDSVHDSDKSTDLVPAHLAIHKIDGYWTWVGTLIPANAGDSAAIQGYTLVPADLTISGSDIVRATTFKEALVKYRAMRAGDTSAEANKNATEGVATGTVDTLGKNVIGGNTVVGFTLKGDAHFYQMQVTLGDKDSNVERQFAESGKKVTIKYRDDGSNTRQVLSYDDLTLQLTG